MQSHSRPTEFLDAFASQFKWQPYGVDGQAGKVDLAPSAKLHRNRGQRRLRREGGRVRQTAQRR